MKKRILSLLLALVMLLGLLPTVALAANETHANQVLVIVENTTFLEATEDSNGEPAWTGVLFEEWVDLTDNSTMMSCFMDAAKKNDVEQAGAENNYIRTIADLSEFDGGDYSGWMGTLNDWFTNVGFAGFTVADGTLSAGDEIRIMYTTNGYGADLGGSWDNNDKTVKAIDFHVGKDSVGTLDKPFDKDTHDYTLTVPAGTTGLLVLPTASNKNFQVRASVNNVEYKRTQTLPVADGTVITVKCGDPSWPSMNNQGSTGASVPAETYTFTVKVDGGTPAQTNYLTDVKFASEYDFYEDETVDDYAFSMSPAFDPNIHDYTITAPDMEYTLYPFLTFRDDTPASFKANFQFEDLEGTEQEVPYDTADKDEDYYDTYWNYNVIDNNCDGATLKLTVPVGTNSSEYTFTVKRQPTLCQKTVRLTSGTGSDAIVYGVDGFQNTTFSGYSARIPYDGAYLSWEPFPGSATYTVKVNGAEFTKGSKLDAAKLWQGEAGSRHFDLTLTVDTNKTSTVTTTYTIACTELPAALTIKKQPAKTTYYIGDTFDPTGMVASVQYEGGAVEIPLQDLTIQAARFDKAGDAEVTVRYNGLSAKLTVNVKTLALTKGSGTKEDPYLLENADDLEVLSALVAAGNAYAGKYFKITNDITLPANWTPIGGPKAGKTWTPTISQRDMNPFSGYVDGAKADGSGCYTITVPEGSKTMIGALAGGKLSNLNIYGKKIDGYGVVEYYYVDRSNPVKAEIDNVTLKSGSHTKYSGFIGGYASGVDVVLIRNCTVEAGVIIGDDGTIPEWAEELNADFPYPWGPTGLQYRDAIGSFGGMLNGTIENCVSHAKVYGRKFVGGILGFKGQSMGDCIVRNCVFDGEVHATGSFAGGITGGGYSATSAPNTPAASVENCVVTGSVTGATYVGGIFGGEELLKVCWNNGIGYVRGNYFNGKVTATAEDGVAGGIIGYMNSLDCYNVISNNYYITGAAVKGIGKVNEANVDIASGTKYGRSDDPLGKDAEKLAAPFEASALTDGTLVNDLNAAVAGYAWTQGASAPVLSTAKRVVRLTCSKLNTMNASDWKQDTGIGNLNGKKVTVTYSDGTTEEIDASKCALSGIDFTKTGYQLGAITYKGYQLFFGVEMVSGGTAPTDTKAVTVSVLGDFIHDVTTDSVHTLAQGNLTPWLTDVTVVVDKDATALEAFDAACDAYGLSYVAADSSYGGKYISSVTSASGVTLTGKSNKQSDGKSYSGWMYTVDGTSSMVSIDQAAVTSSLVVYFEDDYNLAYVQSVINAIEALPEPATEEAVAAVEAQLQGLSPVARASVTNLAKLTAAREALEAAKAAANVVDLINAIPAEITKDSGAAIKAARDAYDALNDAAKELVPADKLKKLTDAEAKYADLTKPVTPVTPVTPSAPAQLPQNPNAGETLPFTDVNANSWYYSGVKYAYKNGLMNGTGNGTFSPNADTTRGMIVTMLARLEGQNTSGTPWYAAGQKWAMDAGISDGTNMTGAITREQLAAILFRYAKQKGYDVSKSVELNGFEDANTVSTYATDAMRWAVASGLIQGSNSKLNPKGTATRAQVATILMRFMELYAK